MWDFWSHLEIFNAFLLALKHQLTTWTTLLENPFQIQSTVRSKKVGFILWIRGMNIHLTFCMEVGGKKLTGGIVALWLKDFPAEDFYSHQLWSLFAAQVSTRDTTQIWEISECTQLRFERHPSVHILFLNMYCMWDGESRIIAIADNPSSFFRQPT